MKSSWLCFLLIPGLAGIPSASFQAARADPPAVEVPAVPELPVPEDGVDRDSDIAPEPPPKRATRRHKSVVRNFTDYWVRPGEVIRDLVVIGGSAQIDGEVEHDVVVLLGSVTIKGRIHGNLVNIGQGVHLEDGGRIEGDALAIGFGLERGSDGLIKGRITNLGLMALPAGLRDRASGFFNECVLLARPLAPSLGWLWILWAIVLGVHALLGLLFPRATRGILRAMEERPASTALLGVLGLPLVLVAAVIIGATVVGVLALPFLLAAMVVGLGLGRVAIYRFLGLRFLAWFGLMNVAPILQFGVGAAITTALFLIPVVGLVTWLLFILWALGGLLMALLSRESSGTTVPGSTPVASGPSAPVVAPVAAAAVIVSPLAGEEVPVPAMGGAATLAPHGPTAAFVTGGTAAAPGWRNAGHGPVLDSATIAAAPRAAFWRRLGALLIDWVPLLYLVGKLPHQLFWLDWSDYFVLVRTVVGVSYFTGMLTWRGTTLGGLLMGLRVVRTDGGPLTRDVALVRACSAILSALSLGLGWFWAGWDPRGQTWHDKLAGTVVIRDDPPRSLI